MAHALILEVVRNHPALLGTAVVLLSGLVGHFPVVWFLKLTNFLRAPEPGKPNFGRWIGIFERFAITLFVFLDSLGGAVFIFGLKTAVMSWRVEKDDNKKDIVEYVLIAPVSARGRASCGAQAPCAWRDDQSCRSRSGMAAPPWKRERSPIWNQLTRFPCPLSLASGLRRSLWRVAGLYGESARPPGRRSRRGSSSTVKP